MFQPYKVYHCYTDGTNLCNSATWSVANAGNSCRLDFLSVEVL